MDREDLKYVGCFLFACLVIGSLLALGWWASTPTGGSRVDQFHHACEEQGGFVADTGGTFWTNRIDCIKDNEVIYLPGFA